MNKSLILALIASHLVLGMLTACNRDCQPVSIVGLNGVDGVTPTITMRPATLLECSSGGTVLSVNGSNSVLCNGLAGNPGLNGTNGTNGQNGINATPVTVVPLCPGITTYPSTFVEIALCINDELYAVYSIPNAFMTYLPPGSYLSNAINSNCNLTVQPHCKVTH